MQTNVRRLRWSSKKSALMLIGIVLLLAAIVGVLELTNTTYLFHAKKIPPVSTGQYSKGEPQTPATSPSTKPGSVGTTPSASSPSKDSTQQPVNSADTSKPLIAPSGAFVSNHRPNLGGSPAPNTMSSVCTTTSGATCAITFIKDGTTKTLIAQTTDREGSTYWDWKLQDIGLTAGTWKIRAVATLGSQTKTADDAIDLVVSP